MSMKEAVTSVLTQYANFDGRARRSEYWYFTLFEAIVTGVLAGLGSAFFGSDSTMNIFTVLSSLFSLAVFIPGLAVTWRRLHDTGRSGAFFFLTLIPVVGGIILLVFLCQNSTPGDNRFGPNPKAKDLQDAETTQRLLQTAAAHEPPYIYLDPAMTTLDPAVIAAMQRVFPGCDGAAPLDTVLAAQPQPEPKNVDTDTLLVLLKYATVCDPAAVIPRIQTLNCAILTELTARGI